jgi:hypothetical protein
MARAVVGRKSPILQTRLAGGVEPLLEEREQILLRVVLGEVDELCGGGVAVGLAPLDFVIWSTSTR